MAILIAKPLFDFLPIATLILSILGILICQEATRVLSSSDPAPFVLDEVCGMFVSILWIAPSLKIWILAFVLFRLLDTFKPWPIIIFQRMKHPTGIMWDDLAAGFLTNLILRGLILSKLFNF